MALVADLAPSERMALAEWIGERPETILPVAALRSGVGRAWVIGSSSEPAAALVESPLVPGEPQGFGQPEAILELLAAADGWTCVELDALTSADLQVAFDRRWGLARLATDVVHQLDDQVEVRRHPLVRSLSVDDLTRLARAEAGLLPDDAAVVEAAAAVGRLFGAVDDHVIVGQAGSMAAASRLADVGVHVAARYRRRGIATSAASAACAALQEGGLTPVWGTGAHNQASRAVAERLGFREVARLTYLVRDGN